MNENQLSVLSNWISMCLACIQTCTYSCPLAIRSPTTQINARYEQGLWKLAFRYVFECDCLEQLQTLLISDVVGQHVIPPSADRVQSGHLNCQNASSEQLVKWLHSLELEQKHVVRPELLFSNVNRALHSFTLLLIKCTLLSAVILNLGTTYGIVQRGHNS